MKVLFGHPTGNPNAHHAALAHFEAGRLGAFCVPWMPTDHELYIMRNIPGLQNAVSRFERRHFAPLAGANLIQDKAGEILRLLKRQFFPRRFSSESLAYEANDWLMRTMAHHCAKPEFDAVHSFEDCSLWAFQAAKNYGKLCIYDMPIGYYPAWEKTQEQLCAKYRDWLPAKFEFSSRLVRPQQKIQEMNLADLVLTASSFARDTIQSFVDKNVEIAPYGVDLDFWTPGQARPAPDETVRFIYAGQASIRKGTPLLLSAWQAANPKGATLELVGSWQLSENKRQLPPGVTFHGPKSHPDLLEAYRHSDVFIFPTNFEGFGLVLLEAMATGLPFIATKASAGPDILDASTGLVIDPENVDQMIEAIRFFTKNRHRLADFKAAARKRSEMFSWSAYRAAVSTAIRKSCSSETQVFAKDRLALGQHRIN